MVSPRTGADAPEKVRRFRGTRRVLVAAVVSAGGFLGPAQAADQVVTGTVGSQIGIAADGTTGGTAGVTVVRERRGDVVYLTVIPIG